MDFAAFFGIGALWLAHFLGWLKEPPALMGRPS
jgi:hypothetical protein